MVQVRWTQNAIGDLKSIYEFIALDSKRFAQIQVFKIKSRTNILHEYPYAGRIVLEIKTQEFRELIEGSYRIVYKIISDSKIDILTVHHSARDLTRWEF